MQQKYEWTSGGPLAFQQYKHFYYNRNIVQYNCSKNNTKKIVNVCPNITTIKTSVRNKLYFINGPVISNQACTIMLLSNMKEPDWIPIPCNENLVNIIICKRIKKNKLETNYLIGENKSTEFYKCRSMTLLINNKCFAFLWRKNGNIFDNDCTYFKARGVSTNKLTYFYHILNAVSSINQFPILIFQNNSQLHILKVHKLFRRLRFTQTLVQNNTVSGNYICTLNKHKIHIGINIFYCRLGGYILKKYICDGYIDCPNDSSDENMCTCNEEHYSKNSKNICMKMQRRHNFTHCTHNYFMDITGLCKKYVFNMITVKNKSKMRENKKMKMFLCNNGQTLSTFLVNDLISDCGPDSEDEPILLAIKAKNQTFHCKPWEIPCMEGHTRCFNFTDICHYKLNEENHIMPCRNGGHLENCEEFECNVMFKCPNYYCVPWTYVCDGKWDCPDGEDEFNNEVCIGESVCEKMFQCRNEHKKCISISNVCDN